MSDGAADYGRIDIDEFERRMRTPGPRPAGDPLAELARLVTTPQKQPEALDAMFARPEPSDRFSADLSGIDVSRMRGPVHDEAMHVETDAGSSAGSSHDARCVHHLADDAAFAAQEGHYPDPATDAAWGAPVTADVAAAPPAGRPRRPLYLTAAVIGVGLLGIGGTFAFKGHRSGSGELVEVKAASGPTKVAAQTVEGSSMASDSSVLDRGVAVQPVTRVIDRQERPVDLKDAATRAARNNSAQMANLAATAAAGGDTTAMFPEARRVKTVSVRPDGTIVGGSAAPSTSAAAPPSATPSVTMPLSASSSPSAKTSTPKTATRVVPTSKPPVDKPEVAVKPVASKPVAAKPAAIKVARAAEADTDDATGTAAAPTTRGASGGGFVVQLAAPGDEAEAKSTASRLSKKFSGELGGARVTVQKAGDKSVYRVRTAGMSREDAVSACEKVKAAGGACFVAKN